MPDHQEIPNMAGGFDHPYPLYTWVGHPKWGNPAGAVYALQWDGTEARADEIAKMLGDVVSSFNCIQVASEGAAWWALHTGTVLRAVPTDWVLGDRRVVSNTALKAYFRKVEEGTP